MPLYPPASSGSLDITGLTEADVALNDFAAMYDTSAAANRKMSVDRIIGFPPSTNQGRLTLVANTPVYAPNTYFDNSSMTVSPSLNTVTFSSAHGLVTGTAIRALNTVGGVTANTRYYINAVSSTVITLHTTIAIAVAGTPLVDLTGTFKCAAMQGSGSNILRFTPFHGNKVALYDGTRWKLYTFAEVTLALATAGVAAGVLVVDKNYDVFLYDNSGTLTLEALVWTDNTTRATALVLQDGVWCKTGALTRRWVGTFRSKETAATESHERSRLLLSAANQIQLPMFICPGYIDDNLGTTYSMPLTGWAIANGGVDAKLEFVTDGLNSYSVNGGMLTSGGSTAAMAISEDSITSTMKIVVNSRTATNSTASVEWQGIMAAGFHFLALMIKGAAAAVAADQLQAGAPFDQAATYLGGAFYG